MKEEDLLAAVQKELVEGNNESALKLARQILQKNPESGRALLLAGYACELMDNFDEAVASYETALESDPSAEVVRRLRMCLKTRATRSGKKVSDKQPIFTARERAVYDKHMNVETSRSFSLQIEKEQVGEADITSTHFGGIPYAEKGKSWPNCKRCTMSKNFVGQFAWDPSVNDPQIEKWTTQWLVTLFYCFKCLSKDLKPNQDVFLYKAPSSKSHSAITPDSAPHLVPLGHYPVELLNPTIKRRFFPTELIPDDYLRSMVAAEGAAHKAEMEKTLYDEGYLGGFDNSVVILDYPVGFNIHYDQPKDNCTGTRLQQS